MIDINWDIYCEEKGGIFKASVPLGSTAQNLCKGCGKSIYSGHKTVEPFKNFLVIDDAIVRK